MTKNILSYFDKKYLGSLHNSLHHYNKGRGTEKRIKNEKKAKAIETTTRIKAYQHKCFGYNY